MRFSLLVMSMFCLPISSFCNEDPYPQETAVSAFLCSEYAWVETEVEEYQRVCISTSSSGGNEFTASYWRECLIGEGDCPNSPFLNKRAWCIIDSRPWGDFVDVMNKNRVELHIPPDADCQYAIGVPLGAELSAVTNGRHVLKRDIERLESRYRDGNRHCWSTLGGGTEESRSADMVAVIDGWEVIMEDYINFWHGERWGNRCSH